MGVCKRCDSKGDSGLPAPLGENEGQVPRVWEERREQRQDEEALGFVGRLARQRGCGGKACFLSPPPLKH